jgi:alkanesulfonate monooxygenase SsuD/methylene tetrahydromethanopterin reductase-like flavin-dependent oxidoreductase (luciferase family)
MLKFGISLFFTEYSMTPTDLARELEQRGFESVWSGEHSHIPAAMKTPFPGDGGIKRHYLDVMDPFVTLTAAAMATKTLKLGTGVCLIAQRDPI